MRLPCRTVRWLLSAAALVSLLPVECRAQLPDGAGKELVEKTCGTCHPATMVVGRKLSREDWGAEVTKMVQQGAKLTDAEFTQVVNYLALHFAPGQSAAPVAPPPAARGRGVRGGVEPLSGPGRGGAAGGAGPAIMQVVDPVAAERGKTVYIAECVTCHGPRARGASDGVPPPQKGPDLVRSITVLHDRYGNGIGPFLAKGHPMQSGKPTSSLTEPQIADLSHFLHEKVADTLRSGPYSKVQNVLTGNAKEGEAYFNGDGGCNGCHSASGDLAGIGNRLDPPTLQQRFLFPNAGGGRRGGGSTAKPVTVTVTPASGAAISGTLLYMDDFTVALRDASGAYHSVKRSAAVKVEKKDPYQGHIDLLDKYTDKNIHDIVTYLETLK